MSGPPQDTKESAAEMDALNLDDLFLGGDDDDAQGGMMADSLFADMDLDLGDIMDGIIGDEAGGAGGGIDMGMGALMAGDFGGDGGDIDLGGGGLSRDISTASLDGDVDVNVAASPSVGNIMTSSSTVSASNKGKGKVKSRTARSNPHLAMAQQQQQQQLTKEKQNKEKQQLLSSSIHSSQILSPTAKRKRRKSKRAMDDDDEHAPGGDSAPLSLSSINATKKSKRSGSSSRRKLDGSDRSHSSSGILGASSSSILPQSMEPKMDRSSSDGILPVPLTPSSQTVALSQPLQPPAPSPSLDEIKKARKESQQKLTKEAQESLSKFGLKPSATQFFPYMHLPPEVDVKKASRQKAFPLLEKLNLQSSALGQSNSGQEGEVKDEDKIISTSSSIYKLFNEHMGVLTDNHGKAHPPAALQSSLLTSVQQASSFIKSKKKKKQHGHILPQQSASQKHEMIEELSKLYLGCMKQSSFLRQNLWNMERWCTDRFSKEDVKNATGGVKRRDVEWIMKMMTVHEERQEQAEKEEEERQEKEQKLKLLQEHRRKQQAMSKKIDFDKNALPTSDVTMLASSGDGLVPHSAGGYTHGGLHANPVISIKVRVKVAGWRDKSGMRLNARLWTPNGWKAALKRANSSFVLPPLPAESSLTASVLVPKTVSVASEPAKLDLSSVGRAALETVASELVRPGLMPKPKKKEISLVVKKEDAKAASPTVSTTKSVTPSVATSSSKENVSEVKDVKTKPKKRKVKESTTAAATSLSPHASSAAASSSKQSNSHVKKQKQQHIIPHVPGHDKPYLLRPTSSILVSATSGSSYNALKSSASTSQKEGDVDDIHAQSQRILSCLYTQILHPAVSPTQRRQLLANEISSTLSKLENAHTSKSLPKMQSIQKQIEELQSIYEEDAEIVPENCNTIGMWNWMKKSNYFDDMGNLEEVYDGLEGCWQPELGDVDKGREWGGLPLCVSVSEGPKLLNETEEKTGGFEQDKLIERPEESSPLFDRLQSLLVEVDGGSDEENEDDDDLLSSLPPFSPEEFICGPKNNNNNSILVISSDEDDDEGMLDVSALTLDQRTYIQLREVGLVDANATPFFSNHPKVDPTAPRSTNERHESNNDNQSIDIILQKMNSKLSNLHVQNNVNVAALQCKAISHATSNEPSQRNIHKLEEDSTLIKYKQLQKVQREAKEEKQRIIRTSGRVKTGSNKFDGEQWLPW